MTNQTPRWNRLGLLTGLVEKAPKQMLGRTALVKLSYLLQTVRGVPLGYNFRLYTYGPYDADVIDDLSYAEFLEAVTVKTVHYPNGYGYEVRPGTAAQKIKAHAAELLAKHGEDMDWVIREFGAYTAAELELIATIVYVDREFARLNPAMSVEEIARRVREVKPYFAEHQVLQVAKSLRKEGLLRTGAAVTAGS